MGDNNRVLSIVQKIHDVGGKPPGKKVLQKLIYLIEEAGDDLGFEYGIHFYGPYSADLDYAVKYLYSYGLLDIETTPTEHKISLPGNNGKLPPLSDTANRIIGRFGSKTPSDLELLATTLYVQRAISTTDTDNILRGVQKIKGAKYPVDKISDAVTTLQAEQFF
jgi:uncharacterized protein YwgA